LGVLPKAEVFRLLQSAVALFFPSRYEGFGFPLLEAMAAGCPVLALDTPINREVAGQAAWLLPEEPGEWEKTLRRLLTCSSARAEMKEKGFENLARFSWHRTAAIYGQVFKEVASFAKVTAG
jgi:glycosyltransferase involved in cell wall biosynthesis